MNIFVSNLSYSIKSDRLASVFADYGEVISARVVTDRESGRSRGFGFVEMDDEAGKKAIEALNQSELEGRTIYVDVAKPRAEGTR